MLARNVLCRTYQSRFPPNHLRKPNLSCQLAQLVLVDDVLWLFDVQFVDVCQRWVLEGHAAVFVEILCSWKRFDGCDENAAGGLEREYLAA